MAKFKKFAVLGVDSNYCRYYQTKPPHLDRLLCTNCVDRKRCTKTNPQRNLSEREKEKLGTPLKRIYRSLVFGRGF